MNKLGIIITIITLTLVSWFAFNKNNIDYQNSNQNIKRIEDVSNKSSLYDYETCAFHTINDICAINDNLSLHLKKEINKPNPLLYHIILEDNQKDLKISTLEISTKRDSLTIHDRTVSNNSIVYKEGLIIRYKYNPTSNIIEIKYTYRANTTLLAFNTEKQKNIGGYQYIQHEYSGEEIIHREQTSNNIIFISENNPNYDKNYTDIKITGIKLGKEIITNFNFEIRANNCIPDIIGCHNTNLNNIHFSDDYSDIIFTPEITIYEGEAKKSYLQNTIAIPLTNNKDYYNKSSENNLIEYTDKENTFKFSYPENWIVEKTKSSQDFIKIKPIENTPLHPYASSEGESLEISKYISEAGCYPKRKNETPKEFDGDTGWISQPPTISETRMLCTKYPSIGIHIIAHKKVTKNTIEEIIKTFNLLK